MGIVLRMRKNQAEVIIEKCGGVTELAALLGYSYGHVYKWAYENSGYIPAWEQHRVLVVARKNGVDLSPADFFPKRLPNVSKRRRKA